MTRETTAGPPPLLPSFKSGISTADREAPSRQEAHAQKVQMLARVLATRYGKTAYDFVAKQMDIADEANRPTWLAVMGALPR